MSTYNIGYSSLSPHLGHFLLEIAGDKSFDLEGKMGSPAVFVSIKVSQDCHIHINSIIENVVSDSDGYNLQTALELKANKVYTIEDFPVSAIYVHYTGSELNKVEMFFK